MVRALSRLGVLWLALEALFGCIVLFWIGSSLNATTSFAVGFLFAALVIATALVLRPQTKHLQKVGWRKKAPLHSLWFLLPLIAGVALRIWVADNFPATQFSDFQHYTAAAQHLLDTGNYRIYGDFDRLYLAGRAPGIPLLLAGMSYVTGSVDNAIIWLNVSAFALLALGLFRIGSSWSTPAVAGIALWIAALHPSAIGMVSLANAGTVGAALLVAFLWTATTTPNPSHIRMLLAGMVLGLLILVKPEFLIAPFLFGIAVILWSRKNLAGIFLQIAILCVGTAMIVGPWTARNCLVLDSCVLVSTNGGSNFYRANNPMATGYFSDHGERQLVQLAHDEVKMDRLGYRLGIEWIKDNPQKFLLLAFKKQSALFADAFYRAGNGLIYGFERGHDVAEDIRDKIYLAGKIFWGVFWFLFAVSLLTFGHHFARRPHTLYFVAAIAIPILTHSVFEGQARYLMPAIPILSLFVGELAAWLIFPSQRRVR